MAIEEGHTFPTVDSDIMWLIELNWIDFSRSLELKWIQYGLNIWKVNCYCQSQKVKFSPDLDKESRIGKLELGNFC